MNVAETVHLHAKNFLSKFPQRKNEMLWNENMYEDHTCEDRNQGLKERKLQPNFGFLNLASAKLRPNN